ncbi:hypothetical protein BIV60_10240 [Bacillus sp. MUM 116]|nr:hypothetical protein BIV60_10240 [Bacillus sp. MUM 116]
MQDKVNYLRHFISMFKFHRFLAPYTYVFLDTLKTAAQTTLHLFLIGEEFNEMNPEYIEGVKNLLPGFR